MLDNYTEPNYYDSYTDYSPKTTWPYSCQDKNYYAIGGIECIDYIKAKLTKEQYEGYLLGNVLKYTSRCEYKGEKKKDIEKLAKYAQWLKELYDNN